ncbi:hypothetical protein GF402_07870 [Candidatus Fermentibacteria bacterium]|nr:hypothetical protein [Candidatus Fermentibacteria bacterium]
MKRFLLIAMMLVLTLGTAALVGCGGDGTEQAEETEEEAVEEEASGGGASETEEEMEEEAVEPDAEEPGEATSGAGTPETVDPVSWESLIELLPDAPSGWTADEPSGQTMSSPGFSTSMSERTYESESTDEDVEIVLVDNAYSENSPWATQFDTAFEFSSSDGHLRHTEVHGYPAIDIYSAPDDYDLLVLVSERFFVSITSETEESRDQFADLIDYAALAGL